MSIFNFQSDPMQLCGNEITEFNGSVTDYLIDRKINPNYISILINGENIPTYQEAGFIDPRLTCKLNDSDSVTIISQPKGVDPFTIAMIAVVASVATSFLLKPSINPNNSGVTQDSPNNTLQSQNNIARPYQAIPDVYGEPVCVPDLSGEATEEYVNQQKIIRQIMPICIQTYEVDSVQADKTPLENIDGTYTVYTPVNGETIIPEVTETFSINEVDGQELLAPNQSDTELNESYLNVNGVYTAFSGGIYTIQTSIDLSEIYELEYPAAGTLKTGRNGGNQAEGEVLYISVTLANGVYTVRFSSDVLAFDAVDGADFMNVLVRQKATAGPFTSTSDGEQLWFDITFPRGLIGTVDIDVDYTVTSATGTESNIETFTFSANKYNQLFYTNKITSTVGAGEWTVSFIRTNNTPVNSNPTQANLERVATISQIQNKNYGDVTILDVSVPATKNATSLRENRIKVNGGRKVISYDTTTKQIDYTLKRSRLGADHILHEFVMVFNRSPESIDLDTLYSIYNGLADPRLGYFDWTFDDLNTSLGQRINTIANAARIFVIPQGSTYTFRRDELQAFPSTILTRADIARAGRKFTETFQPQMNSDKDSVKVEYVNSDKNVKAFINLKYENGQFVEGQGVNPLRIELPCCKEEFNAMNRAQLEIRKLYYLRKTITDTFLEGNANLIEEGELIRYENVYSSDTGIGGSIRAINGNVLTLSEIVPDGSDLMISWVSTTGQSNNPVSFTKLSSNQIQLASNPTGAFAPSVNNSKGSSYMIYSLETFNTVEYTASAPKFSNDGKTVQLVLAKADSRVYDYDTEQLNGNS